MIAEGEFICEKCCVSMSKNEVKILKKAEENVKNNCHACGNPFRSKFDKIKISDDLIICKGC